VKVLHIGKYFEPFKGGVETYLRDLMFGLTRQGVTCAALVHRHQRSIGTRRDVYDEGDGPVTVWRIGTWFRLLFAPISPGFPLSLSRMLREWDPDILHLHLPNPSALWVLVLPAARRRPWVVHWHSDVVTDLLGPLMRMVYALYRPLERALLRRARLVVATSRSYLESSESLQLVPDSSRVIPLGLDPQRLASMASLAPGGEATTPAGELRVLAIGRLTYYKGFGYLVEAAARAPGVSVHIVGQGECRSELERLARHLGVSARVTFHGALDDAGLANQLRRCDCVCLPSVERTEAFGLVLLEAMYFSRATVVSDVRGSGMGSVVKPGVTGLLVPPRQAGALAEALIRLRDDPALRRQLGEAGRRRFEERYSIEHGVRELARDYRALLAPAPVTGGFE